MEFLTREADGSVVIREFVGTATITNEALTAFTEAKSTTKGKSKLVVTIAGIHEGVTRNLTEYLRDELEKSVPTWTTPYKAPVLINHDQGNVNATIGRVINTQLGDHNGMKALMFTVEVTDPEAIAKIKDERYFTVSIGSRAGGVKCSICGNDWAESYCEHERGHYYLTDENDPKSAKQCTWQIVGMEGLEISYVPVPSDKNAMNVAASFATQESFTQSESLDDLCAKLYMFSESGAIDLIKKDGTMEHVGEEAVVTDLLEEADEEEVETSEEDATSEEEVVTDEETADEEVAEEEVVVADEEEAEVADEEVADEEVAEEEVVEDEAGEEVSASAEEDEEVEDEQEVVGDESAIQAEIDSIREELRATRIELLLALRGIDNIESEEATEVVSRYESIDGQVLVDLIRGERANKIAIGLAEVKGSVSNPTLTEDPTGVPHNPSENKTSVRVKVKGSGKTLEITPKEDRIKSVKVRR